ncbi:hypothetical protein HPB48_009646 [Haemaphysalis longicornis]|uniref:Winged helix Storkhead-box1 domain-containing protein n=1 Tax=Haemaphysalis longicornis TaxID=44386 RepID=A0A9J6FCB2_HAELO|nr:hypothetical protein HPB48_009646 [Haemaphysalis longicornis]
MGPTHSGTRDVSSVEMVQVLQTQFAPLAEALCKAVFDLTSRGSTATLDTISAQLGQAFPAIERPGADVVYRALGALIRERRLYHTGLGYQVAAPDTFLQTSPSPVPTERPMLLTNEEAISRLHGSPAHTTDESAADGSTLERSASMRLLRPRAGASDEGLALGAGSRLSRSSSVRLCRSSPAHDGLGSTPAAPPTVASGKRATRQDAASKRTSVPAENSCSGDTKCPLSRRVPTQRPSAADQSISLARPVLTGKALPRVSWGSPVVKREDACSLQTACQGKWRRKAHYGEVQGDGKASMFSRWFRRSRSEKRPECKKQLSSFSAQFPPLEWSDPDYARFHSRATQTNAVTQPDTHPYAALLKVSRTNCTFRGRGHSAHADNFIDRIGWTGV